MTPATERQPFWIDAGDAARVLIRGERIDLVVYWQTMESSAFYWFAASNPQSHNFLQEAEADDVTEERWEAACELASREYYEPIPAGAPRANLRDHWR